TTELTSKDSNNNTKNPNAPQNLLPTQTPHHPPGGHHHVSLHVQPQFQQHQHHHQRLLRLPPQNPQSHPHRSLRRRIHHTRHICHIHIIRICM
ncbi:hypothetical protein HK102_005150, partial [Quaeritorhiza haematococci]